MSVAAPVKKQTELVIMIQKLDFVYNDSIYTVVSHKSWL